MKKILVLFILVLTGCQKDVVESFINYPHDFSNVELDYHYVSQTSEGMSKQLYYDDSNAYIVNSIVDEKQQSEISYFIEEQNGVVHYYKKEIDGTVTWGMELVGETGLNIKENLVLEKEYLTYIGEEMLDGDNYSVIEVLSFREVYEGPTNEVNYYYYVSDAGELKAILITKDNGDDSFSSEYIFSNYNEIDPITIPPTFVENAIKFGE